MPSKPTKTREKSLNQADPGQLLLQGEKNQQSLLNLSSEWYWEQDEHYCFTRITGEAFERAGFDARDFLGMTHWECDAWPMRDIGIGTRRHLRRVSLLQISFLSAPLTKVSCVILAAVGSPCTMIRVNSKVTGVSPRTLPGASRWSCDLTLSIR